MMPTQRQQWGQRRPDLDCELILGEYLEASGKRIGEEGGVRD